MWPRTTGRSSSARSITLRLGQKDHLGTALGRKVYPLTNFGRSNQHTSINVRRS